MGRRWQSQRHIRQGALANWSAEDHTPYVYLFSARLTIRAGERAIERYISPETPRDIPLSGIALIAHLHSRPPNDTIALFITVLRATFSMHARLIFETDSARNIGVSIMGPSGISNYGREIDHDCMHLLSSHPTVVVYKDRTTPPSFPGRCWMLHASLLLHTDGIAYAGLEVGRYAIPGLALAD